MATKKPRATDVDKEILRLEYCFEKGINFKDRIIQITGLIEENVSFDYLDAALTEMERVSKKAVTIKLNSQGGSVYEALAMIDRMNESPCQIITKCYGTCQSAASLLLAGGDKRYMGRHAWFMHHEANYEIPRASHSEAKDFISQAEREEEQWCNAMAELSNQTKEFWREVSHKFDFYLTAEECLAFEIVDGIL